MGVYGESHTEHKDRAWQTLRSLISTPIKPWLMAGDCNKILFSHENQGGGNEVSSVWRNSERRWRLVGWRIWSMKGTCSHGDMLIKLKMDLYVRG